METKSMQTKQGESLNSLGIQAAAKLRQNTHSVRKTKSVCAIIPAVNQLEGASHERA